MYLLLICHGSRFTAKLISRQRNFKDIPRSYVSSVLFFCAPRAAVSDNAPAIFNLRALTQYPNVLAALFHSKTYATHLQLANLTHNRKAKRGLCSSD